MACAPACEADVPALEALIRRPSSLQAPYYSQAQMEPRWTVFGVDRQLIATHILRAEARAAIAGAAAGADGVRFTERCGRAGEDLLLDRSETPRYPCILRSPSSGMMLRRRHIRMQDTEE